MVFIIACEKTPQVFSVNNFRMVLQDSTSIPSIRFMRINGIEGNWYWREHRINLIHDSIYHSDPSLNSISEYPEFDAFVIDTTSSKVGYLDTTRYDVNFITVYGEPFIEVISSNLNATAHDYSIPVSTYLKIKKIAKDTLIFQMPDSKKVAPYLKGKGYNYFIPYGTDKEEKFPMYITEYPDRLARLLKEISQDTKLFQVSDTIVKK
ncbi:hypothetical protein [Flavihumibacter fluvii]|uniref:hypothetical protein n=1 Tax=Flavihumibacter fluvii TaxID=2838157 RepID=UPI001BDE01B2|nr:hypothetical protein [Flavihumibacter fluvii]ULQ52549.1 hypothetical protein KJS93_20885 [Flavihumibacter fluvii]